MRFIVILPDWLNELSSKLDEEEISATDQLSNIKKRWN